MCIRDRDNVIDQYISDVDSEELLENWEKFFTVKPEPLTPNEKKDYLKGIRGVALASDAFFPFDDNTVSYTHLWGVPWGNGK